MVNQSNKKKDSRERSFWMEYEGIGCPELVHIKEENPCQLVDILRKELLDSSLLPGITNEKIKASISKVSTKSRKEIDIRPLFNILKESIILYWEQTECRLKENIDIMSKEQNKVEGKQSSLGDERILYWSRLRLNELNEIIKKDIMNGHLSTCIEYWILEILTSKLHGLNDIVANIDQLSNLLVDVQEYSLLKALKNYLYANTHSYHTEYLIDYVNTITIKDEFNAFMAMKTITKYVPLATTNTNDWRSLLILNQAAFCCMVLKDFDKAAEYESRIMKVASLHFHKYISCINMARLYMRGGNHLAILPILIAINYVSELENNESYHTILLTYLMNCCPQWISSLRGLRASVRSNLNEYYGNNWRLAQAIKTFTEHTNYLIPEGRWCAYGLDDESYESIECKSIDMYLEKEMDSIILKPYLDKAFNSSGSDYIAKIKDVEFRLNQISKNRLSCNLIVVSGS